MSIDEYRKMIVRALRASIREWRKYWGSRSKNDRRTRAFGIFGDLRVLHRMADLDDSTRFLNRSLKVMNWIDRQSNGPL